MPVIGEDADEVVGILYLRDVARLDLRAAAAGRDAATVTNLARRALFVPESKKADETLRQMQLSRTTSRWWSTSTAASPAWSPSKT